MYDVLRGYMFKELRKKTTAKDSKLVRKDMITCGVAGDIMMMMTTRTKLVLLLAHLLIEAVTLLIKTGN